MHSHAQKLAAVLVGGALAALQGAAASAATRGPDLPSEAPITAVPDAAQLREVLDLHNFAEQGREEVNQAGEHEFDDVRSDVGDAMNDAQNAQQDAGEAKQEGQDQPNGQTAGSNSAG